MSPSTFLPPNLDPWHRDDSTTSRVRGHVQALRVHVQALQAELISPGAAAPAELAATIVHQTADGLLHARTRSSFWELGTHADRRIAVRPMWPQRRSVASVGPGRGTTAATVRDTAVVYTTVHASLVTVSWRMHLGVWRHLACGVTL